MAKRHAKDGNGSGRLMANVPDQNVRRHVTHFPQQKKHAGRVVALPNGLCVLLMLVGWKE